VLAATTITAAATAVLMFVALDARLFDVRHGDQTALDRVTAVVGAASADALRNRDSGAARQVISAAQADPKVLSAALYLPDGSLMAGWSRPNRAPVARRLDQQSTNAPGTIELFRPISSDGEVVGTIFLAAEQERPPAIDSALRIAVAAIVALAIALGAAWVLKRSIADRVKALTRVARDISEHRTFSLRAATTSRDEVGDLVDCFNTMLGEIEVAHAEIRRHRDRLEEEVMLRTSELGGANALLTAAKQVAESTARRNAELSQKNELILESAAEGIFGLDAAGRVTFINRAASEMLEWNARDLIGRVLHPLLHGSNEKAATARDECGVCRPNGKSATNRRADFRTISGDVLPVEYNSAPIRDAGDLEAGVVVTFRDIRERLAIEQMKDEFVSTVSHELRTPLTSIRGALGLLASGLLGTLHPRGQKMFEIATRNTDRLIRLVNDILDVERLTSGRVELCPANIKAADLMQQAGDVMQGLADRFGVRLEVEPLTATIFADPDRVMQILTNLLSNAIKFSPAGEVVRLAARRGELEVIFDVIDRGRGIPPDKLDLVFERFKQVDASDARDKGGSGLGLAIVRGIAEAHGGRVWVSSILGSGSTFSIALPAVAADEANDPVAMQAAV
jgi:PAS domain S-box-containing protein